MSQLEIQILHQDYLLTCPEGREAQLLEAVERVDQQFQAMRDTSKLRSRERVGVLLAVNLAYENLELRNQLQALQQQLAAEQSEVDMAPPTEMDSLERSHLQALQAQSEVDQTAAQQLLARLDAVLFEATAPSEPPAAGLPDTEAMPEAVQEAPTSLPTAGTVTTTEAPALDTLAELNNDPDMDLCPTPSENA